MHVILSHWKHLTWKPNLFSEISNFLDIGYKDSDKSLHFLRWYLFILCLSLSHKASFPLVNGNKRLTNYTRYILYTIYQLLYISNFGSFLWLPFFSVCIVWNNESYFFLTQKDVIIFTFNHRAQLLTKISFVLRHWRLQHFKSFY